MIRGGVNSGPKSNRYCCGSSRRISKIKCSGIHIPKVPLRPRGHSISANSTRVYACARQFCANTNNNNSVKMSITNSGICVCRYIARRVYPRRICCLCDCYCHSFIPPIATLYTLRHHQSDNSSHRRYPHRVKSLCPLLLCCPNPRLPISCCRDYRFGV